MPLQCTAHRCCMCVQAGKIRKPNFDAQTAHAPGVTSGLVPCCNMNQLMMEMMQLHASDITTHAIPMCCCAHYPHGQCGSCVIDMEQQPLSSV